MHLYMYIISSCPQSWEFLQILTLFLYLPLFLQRQLIQLHVQRLTLTFCFNSMFPWCTILLCSSSVKSCSFFLCLILLQSSLAVYSLLSKCAQKIWLAPWRKSKIKFHHCTAMPKWYIVIVYALLLWGTCQFVFQDVSAISFSVFVYKRRKRRLAINLFFFFPN